MKITIKQIVNGLPAFNSLIGFRLDASVAYRLARLGDSMQPYIKAFNVAREAVVKRLGVVGENGAVEIPQDKIAEADEEIDKVLSQEVEVFDCSVSPADLTDKEGKNKPTAEMMMPLLWLIKE